MSMYSESYWKRREEADEARERGNAPPEPEVEVAESVAPLSSVDTASAVQTDDESAVAPPVPAPVAAPDPMKAERLRAIERIRQLGESEYEPPEGLRDSDIAAASSRDREQTRRDNFTEALAAAIARRPARMQSLPAEGGTLAQRRAQADAMAQRKMGREMDANARIAAALKSDPPKPAGAPKGGLTEFQKYTIDRNTKKDADAEEKAKLDAESLENARALLQNDFPDYDLSKADKDTIARLLSLRHAKAGEALAAAGFTERKNENIDRQAADLAEKLGDPSAFQSKYDRLMALKAANGGEIPGLGIAEGVRQQPGVVGGIARKVSPPSGAAIEGRKLVRQLAAEYARAISGAGVSNQERAQLNAATLDVENEDSRIAEAGLNTLKDMYETKVAITKAGARPEAVQRIENAPKPAGRPVPPPSNEAPPTGAIPPNAKNVRKRGRGWAYQMPDGSWEVWEP